METYTVSEEALESQRKTMPSICDEGECVDCMYIDICKWQEDKDDS